MYRRVLRALRVDFLEEDGVDLTGDSEIGWLRALVHPLDRATTSGISRAVGMPLSTDGGVRAAPKSRSLQTLACYEDLLGGLLWRLVKPVDGLGSH